MPQDVLTKSAKSQVQSILLKWTALGPDYEYRLRQSVHFPCFILYIGSDESI